MPFGLKNAPSTFQRLRDDLFQDQQEFVAVYIDDLAMYSTGWILHMKQLRQVLSILQEAGLTLRVDKCLIGSSYCSTSWVIQLEVGNTNFASKNRGN